MAINTKTDSIVDKYTRGLYPANEEDFSRFIQEELTRLETFTDASSQATIQVADRAVTSPKKGMVRFAVSPWDPIGGSFQGLVVYNGSAWVRVDTDTDTNTQNTLSDLGITSSAANINKYTDGTDLVIDANGYVTMPNQPAFHVNSSIGTTQSSGVTYIGSNGTSGMQGNQVVTNVGNHFTVADGKWTVPVAGRYHLYLDWTPSTSTQGSGGYITKNGSMITYQMYAYSVAYNGASVSITVDLAANDYVQGIVAHYNNVSSGVYHGGFGGFMIG